MSEPLVDPETANEIANIASKACIEKFGPSAEFDVKNWRVRENREYWNAQTNVSRRAHRCGHGIEIAMSDRKPDFLGCSICVTAT